MMWLATAASTSPTQRLNLDHIILFRADAAGDEWLVVADMTSGVSEFVQGGFPTEADAAAAIDALIGKTALISLS